MSSNVKLAQIKFLKSAPSLADCPLDSAREIAFVGRSNAGKSSAINTIVSQKIAKTSKTPGLTKLINFFEVSESYRLVDLPGYGFAKISDKERKRIESMLSSYLEKRNNLYGVFLIMDCRHPLTDLDIALMELITASNRYIHILLTKSDKISKSAIAQTINQIKQSTKKFPKISVQAFSSLKRTGLDDAINKINEWFTA